ncbi:MAG: cytochrome c3 family protein [Bacteroidota bacterium]
MKRFFFGYKKHHTVLLIFLISVFSACTTEKWHRTMTFFFDGVPDTTVHEVANVKDSFRIKDTVTNRTLALAAYRSENNIHTPYKERSCNICHDSTAREKFTKELPDLCYNCHDNLSTKFKYLHSPVASGACTDCHNPHKSKSKKLLLREGQDMCFHCHDKKETMKNEVHKNIGETNCTECHNPHGGDDRFIFN